MNSGFRNSDGWNCANADAEPAPRAVHLDPDERHQRPAQHEAAPHPTSANRRAIVTGSIDTPIITGSDTPTHISCRQK